MLSTGSAKTLYGKLTRNEDSSHLSDGLTLINGYTRRILADRNWPFMRSQQSGSTVASQQFYDLPADFAQLYSVYITEGDTRYVPREAKSQEHWDIVNTSQNVTSNIPEWYWVEGRQIGFHPIPSGSASWTVTYRQRHRDLSVDDYTTGTISDATNGSTIVIGNSTNWTQRMDDRWIRITAGNSTNTGDGRWYEIDSITNGTTLVLQESYKGDSLSNATASYTIAEVSEIPEDFQNIPVYLAASEYLYGIDNQRADRLEETARIDISNMRGMYGAISSKVAIDDGVFEDDGFINPNLEIEL